MFMDDRTVAQIAPSGDFGNTHLDQLRQPAAVGAAARAGLPAGQSARRPTAWQRRPRRAVAAGVQVFIDPSPARPITAAVAADPAPQRRRRRPPRRPAAHQLPHRRRHERRPQRRLVVRHVLPVRADQLRRDLLERLLGPPPRPRARRRRRSGARRASTPICRSALADGTRPELRPLGHLRARLRSRPAALAYLQTPGFQRGVNQQTVANASVTGDLGELGHASSRGRTTASASPLGVEYRKETLELLVDQAFSTLPSSDLAGQGAPTLPVARRLRRQGSLRRGPHPDRRGQLLLRPRRSKAAIATRITASAAAAISTDTYKVGVDFAPIRDIRFRATYNRAVRAPNIQELFAPQRVALDGSTDPCAGARDHAGTARRAAAMRAGRQPPANTAHRRQPGRAV